MHIHNTAPHTHEHYYPTGHESHSERRTWYVVGIAAAMMMAEIVGGFWFNSMALLAEGWHMSTHAGALGIAGFAYLFARREAKNPRFTFGTGKVTALGGFTSAVILAIVALFIAFESISRLLQPLPIVFNEALLIAVAGLGVNLLSAWLLGGSPDHHHHAHDDHHHHAHEHHHAHDHADDNLRAAYLHVLADAMTSLLAIFALCLVKYKGWDWMDPAVGIVGSFVIASWSLSLLRRTGRVLLDSTPDTALETAIRTAIEADADNQVTDLHLWNIAPGKASAIISLVTDAPQPPQHYKALLHGFIELAHVTVEVNPCE